MELQAGSASDAVVFAQEQQPGETRLGVSRSAQLATGNILDLWHIKIVSYWHDADP